MIDCFSVLPINVMVDAINSSSSYIPIELELETDKIEELI
jgi:hypothetical protein